MLARLRQRRIGEGERKPILCVERVPALTWEAPAAGWLPPVLPVLRSQFLRPAVQAAARNFAWLAAEKAVRLAFGVGVGLWMARYLGPVQLGMFGYCTAVITLLAVLPALSLEPVVKREVLEQPTATADVLASALGLRLVAAGLAFGVVVLIAWRGWGVQGEERRLLFVLGLLLFQPALLVPDLWLQARLRASWSVLVQLSALVVCSLVRIGLILSEGVLLDFAVVAVVEMALTAVGIQLVARRLGLRVTLAAARGRTMVALLRESWPLLIASLAVVVYMKIDEVMLRHLAGTAAVGIYSAAVRLSEIWYFLPLALASSLLPALLRARAQGASVYALRMQQYYDASAALAYALSVPVALMAPAIVKIAYGEPFVAAGPILAVHIWASVFVFLGVARGQWLVNERLPGFYLVTTLVGAVVNVVLNLIAIPRWGGLGAAWSTLIAYGVAAWLMSFCHASVRPAALMQTRALLIPLTGWRYLRQR